MARYIDAEKMREDWLENGENEFVYDTNAVLDSIDAQPTADVVEVKHGEWIDTGDEILDTTYSGWKCSECGYVFCGNKFKFCPECGAKMDVSKMETSTEGGKVD